ncbi:PREDICTED: BLOC-1-related complex subunit 5-like [Amphimedon queenslandica]|uniref:BLOC-1-related complex subunit 5 n=1 Tax=Amphimedon queenslandica TaxID=400682 RepID=A0A1X7VAA1_AMPQE|nr:PREDICTED: BLOC-1-related complex subunit 5-like [Amphimedon queenslandica]|eukprot:XP_019850140.1 PREDICTED: BLOC-1-related complex subunit 5-like [Amphimedon queenslandica]
MGQNESTLYNSKVVATEKEQEEEEEEVREDFEEFKEQQTSEMMSPRSKGITVVNPRPEDSVSSRDQSSLELARLKDLPKFWPILKSTLDYEYPLESFQKGLSSPDLLSLSQDYKKHLNLIAQVIANKQRALASRMKDIEMFSAGIAQQLEKRHERIEKALPHLERVNELSQVLDNIGSLLDDVVPLMNRINYSLPESSRLEQLTVHKSTHPSPPLAGGQNLRHPLHGMGMRVQSEHENEDERQEEEEEEEEEESD